MAVSKLSPASGANDFNLNIGGTYTSTTFTKEYSSGAYSITSSVLDTAIDIYAYNSDGSLAGYTSTKALTTTKGFNKIVVIGGTSGDVLGFAYKTTFATSNTTSEVAAGPFITDITPSSMPNQNNTITITGGNFATNVSVAFTGTGYSSTVAKSIVRSSVSQLIVTRPDNFPTSGSPYTVTVTNPGVDSPVGTNAHIGLTTITAGVMPSWTTATTLPAFQKTASYSQSVVATDADGSSSVTYSLNSSTLPTGITFNAGTFSGVPTTNGGSYAASIRATDSGGNYVDRIFTMTQDKPDEPTNIVATAYSATSAGIAFTAPSYTGTSTITSYTATSSPGGITATLSQAGSGTIIITGLTALTAYTFTVKATNSSGLSVSSTTSNSITTPNSPATVEYLVVAGGGGGGVGYGGGGGAGGYRTSTLTITSLSNLVSIGAGGAGGPDGSTNGTNGSNSQFASIIASGGGGGGTNNNGLTGGSAGGGGHSSSGRVSGNAGGYTPAEGNAGGQGFNAASATGGAGGGAGAAGADGTVNANGPTGGAGANNSITGSSIAYAGGGGGAVENGSTYSGGAGGAGGGGAGGRWTTAVAGTAGTANLGGGGGAGKFGANGGSGVVVIAYPNTYTALTIPGTLTYDQPTRSGYRVYRFTAGTGTVSW